MPWVTVASIDDVERGEVITVNAEPHELVVWRSYEGVLCAMDARCPHQWSHLATEGVVDGEELVCRAHFWRFDACGHGSKINVLGRRDAKADVEVFPCREQHGRIEVDVSD
jgi:nitrite reductase/ring-hydroxylating ferredoxin subunit